MRPDGRHLAVAVAIVLGVLVAARPGAVDGDPGPKGCRSAADHRRTAAAQPPFDDLTPPYIFLAFFGPDGRPHGSATGDEAARVASGREIVLAVSGEGRISKLLVARQGEALLVARLETYPVEAGKEFGASDQPSAQAVDLLVRPGEGLDLDAGRVSTSPADVVWERRGSSDGLRAVGGARVAQVIALPVVVHRMSHAAAPDDVPQLFPASDLADVFVTTGRRNRANTLWAPAGILFYLAAIEDCTYSLDDQPFAAGTPGPPASGPAAIPWPLGDCQAMFRRVNRVYNAPRVGAVDLYVWRDMERALGYAAAHRSEGASPGPGAVWLDRRCAAGAPSCHRVFAHEVGHFLGLCHSCVAVTPPEDRGRCGFCPAVRQCEAVHDGLLMRDDQEGNGFTVEEIRAARRKAADVASGR